MKIIENYKIPKELVGAEVKPQLLAQAVRVYLSNQRQGTQSALTRAEVSRTRKKFQKQKGSGNARHGDRKAPIFVGGGVSFAPKPRDYSQTLLARMRKVATLAAMAEKDKGKKVIGVSGLSKVAKTKELAKILEAGKKYLVVTDGYQENVYRAGRNIAGVTILPKAQVNAYEVLKADFVVMEGKEETPTKDVTKSKKKS